MDTPNGTVILAADIGGSKCEILAVDANTGDVIKEIRQQADLLPAECQPKQNFGGAGRSKEMLSYCMGKMLGKLSFSGILPCGNMPREMFFAAIPPNMKMLDDYLHVGEAEGVLCSEDLTWGMILAAGTGTIGMTWLPDGRTRLIDAAGPILGDWGSGYYIGHQFLRLSYREQESQIEPLDEMKAICEHLDAYPGIAQKPNEHDITAYPGYVRKANEQTLTENYNRLNPFVYVHNDRSIIASLSQVCDNCAKKGSTLARRVLQDAADNLAETAIRASKRNGFDKMESFPLVASGSVLMNNTFVFNIFNKRLEADLPIAKVIRATRPQVCGQIVKRFRSMNLPDYQARMAHFFESYRNRKQLNREN